MDFSEIFQRASLMNPEAFLINGVESYIPPPENTSREVSVELSANGGQSDR